MATNDYVDKVIRDIRQSIHSSKEHEPTETAEIFVQHTDNGVEAIARLHEIPNIPDATVMIHYKDENGDEDFLVKVTVHDKHEPLEPSFRESSIDDLKQYLKRQLLDARLSL